MPNDPGRVHSPAPDPDQHYRLAEAIEYELRVLADAMRAAHTLCEGYDEADADFAALEAGALFRVFGEYTARLVADARFHPARPRAVT